MGLQGSLELGVVSAAAASAASASVGGTIGGSDDSGGGSCLIPGDSNGGGGGGDGGGSSSTALSAAAAGGGGGGGVAAQKPKLKEGRCPFVGKDGVQCRTNTRLIQFSCQCGINGLCAVHRYADQVSFRAFVASDWHNYGCDLPHSHARIFHSLFTSIFCSPTFPFYFTALLHARLCGGAEEATREGDASCQGHNALQALGGH